MSVSDINSKVALAVTAQESGDYATALKYLRSAKILLAGMADATGPAGAGLAWDRSAIDSMITQLNQLQAANSTATTGGIGRTRINYINPSDGCE